MDKQKRCDKCLHTRLVMSENGLHPVCALSAKAAKDCITGKKDHFLQLDEWANCNREESNYILDPCWQIRPDGSLRLLEVSLNPNQKKGE